MIHNEQVLLMRRLRMDGKSQRQAAAMSGMGERTARRWSKGPLPSECEKDRTWRTRADPLEGVWEETVVPLLQRDVDRVLQGPTVLELLMDRHPGQIDRRHLRTLQRRIRDWRAVHGAPKAVIFEQDHVPGREGAMDFTHASSLGVTIAGEAFDHLLFVFRLSYSGWLWCCLAFGETFEALAGGLQGALFDLGGCTEVARSDNLSAATREIRRSKGRSLTRRYGDLLDHFGMRSTRIRPGQSHENGGAEKANDLLKRGLRQALIVRGHTDFESQSAYESFVQETLAKLNRGRESRLAEERSVLRPLPAQRIATYTEFEAKVRTTSVVRISNRSYSVPSRLIGHRVKVRQHADAIEVYYSGKLIERMPRLRGEQDRRIDYRHVIWSLVRKPGAFAQYRYREELFPSVRFRETWDRLQKWRGERASLEYLRILHLAASRLESEVDAALGLLLEQEVRFDYRSVQAICEPDPIEVPVVSIPAPDLSAYDSYLGAAS